MRWPPKGASSSTSAAVSGRVRSQLPFFAAIGVIGYFVDSGMTYLCARYLGFSPQLARPPGFVTATIINFFLNRAITFRHSETPVLSAFLRYWLVAAAGLAISYGVYSACVLLAPRMGLAVTAAILPLFILIGVGVSMVATFLGFRQFAFRGSR
jgi:putative flippase GtrA